MPANDGRMNAQGERICGAKTPEGPCQATQNLGAGGRCRIHGGPTPTGFASPQLRTGLRAKDVSPALRPVVRDVERHPPPDDPLAWLARQKVWLDVCQRRLAKQSPPDVMGLVAVTDAARKLAMTEARIQFQAANSLPKADVMRFARNMGVGLRDLATTWAAAGRLQGVDGFLREVVSRIQQISRSAGLDPDDASRNGNGMTPTHDHPEPEHVNERT